MQTQLFNFRIRSRFKIAFSIVLVASLVLTTVAYANHATDGPDAKITNDNNNLDGGTPALMPRTDNQMKRRWPLARQLQISSRPARMIIVWSRSPQTFGLVSTSPAIMGRPGSIPLCRAFLLIHLQLAWLRPCWDWTGLATLLFVLIPPAISTQ